MDTQPFTPRPSPWLLLAIVAVLLVTLVFGMEHNMARAGGLLGVAGGLLAMLGIWLASRKRSDR
jgi:hypothetical protein